MGLFRKIFNSKSKIEVSFEEIICISEILYPLNFEEFKALAFLYRDNIKKFAHIHDDFVKIHHIDLRKLDYIDLLYAFGDSKNLVELVDWRGEENEGEIESFILNLSSKKHNWLNTHQFRNENTEINQNDGQFILRLFKVLVVFD